MQTISEAVHQRWDSLTKPRGSLGRLESCIARLAEIQQTSMPEVGRRAMYIFCGDHGITQEGVSLYPSVVTRQMVKNFLAGGAAINVLCRQYGLEPVIVDAGVTGAAIEGAVNLRIAEGTRNFLREPAMSKEQAARALHNGGSLAKEAAMRYDIAGVGEMGIGNSTAAAALLCAFTGTAPAEAVGRGTGLDDAGLAHKRRIVEASLARVGELPVDPLALAAQFGGFEIVTMAGFLMGAAETGLPVVVDGFIGGSAYLIANGLRPAVAKNVFFGHRSAEPGHSHLLAACGAEPLLDFGLRLGEGTGAALAIGILTAAVALYREMATFAQASVSEGDPL